MGEPTISRMRLPSPSSGVAPVLAVSTMVAGLQHLLRPYPFVELRFVQVAQLQRRGGARVVPSA
ncbi:hypothetical protein ACPA9J_10615 [Pseudomonas aeruginosa]